VPLGGTPEAGEETIRSTEEPIYAGLVAAWHQEGRCVPGHRDDEWTRLTTAPRLVSHRYPGRPYAQH